ncbi:cobalamin-independent methionine synthase II family protein [Actinomyces radicidentis]|uniref:Methionine synthase n=1 Tax=Actinomyces radicidentis TaxID=111015 RepID=A0A120KLB4_ACTRD|nr:cobalamin-independent methionine synthase II family protein [Actinomyces radicidentis]AMD87740.1 methionine synthase [Actinomyces radicidentis]
MTDIRTTHVGSLPRTPELLAANDRRTEGTISDEEFASVLSASVDGVVKRQHDLGLSIVNEGEYGHITSGAVDYGAWWNYSFSRLGGLTMTDEDRWANPERVRSTPGNPRLTSFPDRRDRVRFNEAYEDPTSGILTGRNKVGNPKITGPLTYIGGDAVQADVDLLLAGLKANGLTPADGFVAALSPGSAARMKNEYYEDDESLLAACADAMHEEYKAITDAGLTVQIDAPDVAESWDQINPEPSLADYREFIGKRIAAVNRALTGIPEDQVRFHVCWGSWHGPHTTDIPFKDIVDLVLTVKAHGYTFEAAGARHEHEWRLWEDTALPEDKVIIPGVVAHSTNVVEHPELVAERIERFARLVGPERVIASTDCGLGGRVHPLIAWAKLESLTEGARLASKRF